jgi:hypothetical protein
MLVKIHKIQKLQIKAKAMSKQLKTNKTEKE